MNKLKLKRGTPPPPQWRKLQDFQRQRLFEDVQYLAERGFHCETISKATGLTKSQIILGIRMLGIRLRDYRDGKGEVARKILVQVQYAKVI